MTTTIPTAAAVRPTHRSPWPRAAARRAAFLLAVLLVMLRPSGTRLTNKVPTSATPSSTGGAGTGPSHALQDPSAAVRRQHLLAAPPHRCLHRQHGPAAAAVLDHAGPRAGWAFAAQPARARNAVLLTGRHLLARARLTGRVEAAVLRRGGVHLQQLHLRASGHLQLLLLGQFSLGFLFAFRWLERRRPLGRDLVRPRQRIVLSRLALLRRDVDVVCVAIVLLGYLVADTVPTGPAVLDRARDRRRCSAPSRSRSSFPYLDLDQERPLVPEWGLQRERRWSPCPPAASCTAGSTSGPTTSWIGGSIPSSPGSAPAAPRGRGSAVLIATTARRRRHADSIGRRRARSDPRRRVLAPARGRRGGADPRASARRSAASTMPFALVPRPCSRLRRAFGSLHVSPCPALLGLAVLAGVRDHDAAHACATGGDRRGPVGIIAFLFSGSAAPLTTGHLPRRSPERWRCTARSRPTRRRRGRTPDPRSRSTGPRGRGSRHPHALFDARSAPPHQRVLRQLARRLPRRRRTLQPIPVAVGDPRGATPRRALLRPAHRGGRGISAVHAADIRRIVEDLPSGATARHYGDAWFVELDPSESLGP